MAPTADKSAVPDSRFPTPASYPGKSEAKNMETDQLTVRPAIDEDRSFLGAMIWEALLCSPVLVAKHGAEWIQQHEANYWRTWTQGQDPAFVAVDTTRRKLGAIHLKPNGTAQPPEGWRFGIGVAPEARGRGVGQLLIRHAAQFAKQSGATYLSLAVDPTNSRARSLYSYLGFVETGEQDGLIAMRLELT